MKYMKSAIQNQKQKPSLYVGNVITKPENNIEYIPILNASEETITMTFDDIKKKILLN